MIHTLETIKSRCEECGTCWEWKQGVTDAGVPQAKNNGRPMSVRRIVYELENGPIEPGHVITYSCSNRLCVNPSHMVKMTNAERGKGPKPVRALATRKKISDIQRKRGVLNEEIVSMMRMGDKSGRQWARELGINPKTAHSVMRYDTWKDYSNPFSALCL